MWRRPRIPIALRRRAASAAGDDLTGLPMRGQLEADVAAFLDARANDDHLVLHLFDLIGFKKYNDAFGFAAGDAMLRHLTTRLCDQLGSRGRLYRLRGAQFALSTSRREGLTATRELARGCLTEAGEGFLIEAAAGSAVIPRQAPTLRDALKLADQEVHAARTELRQHGLDEGTITPMATNGGLPGSPYEITDLAAVVGHVVGLHDDELEVLRAAASWRDVGVMAIPDEILHERGPLSDAQWHFVKLHTMVGERLLRSNFGLDRVAWIVRQSHERWDGGGYPDGLAGHDIAIAARIVFVCACFQDMTSPRAHRPALTAREAIAELRHHAGTQFDPEIVTAFVSAFSESEERSSATALR